MRVFLSYSSDQRPLAERINHLLLSDGHDVFFDRDDLPPGETYGDRIRRGISRCHIFVFLVSPGSLAEGSYALSELAILQNMTRRRPPVILPVLAVPGLEDRIPAFLRPLTLFEPRGDPAAEIAARVEDVDRRRRRVRRIWATALVGSFVLCIVGLTTTRAGKRARSWIAAAKPDTASTAPVTDRAPTLTGMPGGNGEWTVVFHLPHYNLREILYRFEGEEAFRSTGFERVPNQQTGLPLPRTYVLLSAVKEDRVVFLKLVDTAGKEGGPYRLVFDLETELVASAKQVLEITKWVEFRDWENKRIVYFTHLLSYKNAFTAIRYSFDDETLARTVKFTADHSRSGISPVTDQDELYIDVPTGAKFLAVQLRFIDGSESPVRRFPVR